MHRLTLTALTLALIMASPSHGQSPAVSQFVAKAVALQPDRRHGRELYAKRCSHCHGANGWGDGFEDIPSVAGQRELYLITQLASFATQERGGSTMHVATAKKDVNDPQAIRDLAAFLSSEPVNPDPEHAEDAVSAAGGSLYQRNCAICHGAAAQGSRIDPVPALAGQHYDYLMIQLKSFAKGHRGGVKSPVIDFAAGLSDEEQKGIADYLSRIASSRSGGGR